MTDSQVLGTTSRTLVVRERLSMAGRCYVRNELCGWVVTDGGMMVPYTKHKVKQRKRAVDGAMLFINPSPYNLNKGFP